MGGNCVVLFYEHQTSFLFSCKESDTTERKLSIKCVGHFIDVIESSSQSYKISIYPCFTNRRAETQRLLARGHRAAGGVQCPAIHKLCDLGKLFYLWLSLLTVKMSDSVYSLREFSD